MAGASEQSTVQLFIGVLSGTSIDGIDVALAAFEPHATPEIRLLAAHTYPIPRPLKEKLTSLCVPQSHDEVTVLGTAHREFSLCTAEAIQTLLHELDIAPDAIEAIAFHGQTIRHHPDIETPFTWQLGCADTLAVSTGISVISGFREKDIALGGQGAPLAPAFHQAVFSDHHENRAVVNLGGIANITWLPQNTAQIMGFDCGPASTLLDYWFNLHHPDSEIHFDASGKWATSGVVSDELVAMMLSDPYFAKRPPKSTGREYFTPRWLAEKLTQYGRDIAPADVQASLLELTARSLTHALQTYAPAKHIYCCGGGAHNQALMTRCATLLPECQWDSTKVLGIEPDWVEAMLFAWLGWRFAQGIATDLTSVTGAQRPAILGRYTPAK